MKAILLPLCLLGLVVGSPARAEIYKCTDGSGISTFTDNPRSFGRRQCVSMNMDPVVTVPAPARRERSDRDRIANENRVPRQTPPTPSSFPRVDSGTQQKRDLTRRAVLEDEMATEQRLLSDAQRDLEAAQRPPGNPARLPQLRNEVTAHQKNIEALHKELQRLR